MDKLNEKERIQKYQTEEMSLLIQKTLPYIKPELVEDWKNLFAINSDSLMCIAVMRMVSDMILAVGSGKTFDEMDKEICCEKHGASGFSMGWSIAVISKYTVFGESIKRWWNRQWGVNDDENGVVNPAIITISDKPKQKKV